MRAYPQEFRESIVRKACQPGAGSVFSVARENDISHPTLARWIRSFSKGGSVSDRRKKYSARRRLEILFETQNLSEEKFGEYLREEGLHSYQIEEWKAEALAGIDVAKKGAGRPRLDPELVKAREENKQLKRDLNRKNKALAEQTALVILQKKAQALWGKVEDED